DGEWRQGAQAYRGITVAGFPNLFLLYGPNTNLGHNSIVFMIECQVDYAVQAIRTLVARDLAWLAPRPEAMEAWNRRLQEDLARTVWARTPASWYKTKDGRITNNWSGSTTRYWLSTRRFDAENYVARERGVTSTSRPCEEPASASTAPPPGVPRAVPRPSPA
ncbi:MAG: hypothetical protein ACKPBU_15365, partial [Alphaproteobacteria bacterium]